MLSSIRNPLRKIVAQSLTAARSATAVRSYSAAKQETDEEFDRRWESYFKK